MQLGAVLGAGGDRVGPAFVDVALLAGLGDGRDGLAVVVGDGVHLAPDAMAAERDGLVADNLRLERDRAAPTKIESMMRSPTASGSSLTNATPSSEMSASRALMRWPASSSVE